MSSNMVVGLFTLGAALLGALVTVAVQIYLFRKQKTHQAEEDRVARRMAIISDLVAYRYVLTGRGNTKISQFHFNSALSRIPIEFIDDTVVIDAYRSIGDKFSPEKYHNLILSLISATRELPSHVDIDLIRSVPSIMKPANDESTVFNLQIPAEIIRKNQFSEESNPLGGSP